MVKIQSLLFSVRDHMDVFISRTPLLNGKLLQVLSSVGQDDLEPYEYACEVLHKLFKFKSLSSAQNYLFLAMPHDRSLMFVFLVFHWLV